VNLDSVAVELSALVGDYLDVNSLRSLRLVSNSIKRLFTPTFQPHLQDQSINLSRSSLDSLCELAANKELNTAVQSLKLNCLYFFRVQINDKKPHFEPISESNLVISQAYTVI
jgi:hypothetical protein